MRIDLRRSGSNRYFGVGDATIAEVTTRGQSLLISELEDARLDPLRATAIIALPSCSVVVTESGKTY